MFRLGVPMVLSSIIHRTRGDFIRRLIAIALPITLQSIMFSSRGLVVCLLTMRT
jgi:hypothetical protein